MSVLEQETLMGHLQTPQDRPTTTLRSPFLSSHGADEAEQITVSGTQSAVYHSHHAPMATSGSTNATGNSQHGFQIRRLGIVHASRVAVDIEAFSVSRLCIDHTLSSRPCFTRRAVARAIQAKHRAPTNAVMSTPSAIVLV